MSFAVSQILIVLLLSHLALACGTKTGLLVPDAARDVVAIQDVAIRDISSVCIPGQFKLEPHAADVVLVIDRSGSMAQGLSSMARPSPDSPSRWTLVRQALRNTLPMFSDRINVGALFFPQADARTSVSCALPDVPDIDIEPAPDNVVRVIAEIDATSPGGSTPTYAALHRAYTWFVRSPNRGRARYLVLVTDGAPNCNALLDPGTCTCTGGPGGALSCGDRTGSAERCLDDMRTVSAVREIASNPATAIPTYIIGIAPDDDPAFGGTLTAMAIAGRRPKVLRDGTRTFYSVREPGDLALTLADIQRSIARCSFVASSRPDDPDDMAVAIDGRSVTRDTSRINGWDWTDLANGEITLFGATCTEASTATPTVVATVGCSDAGR